MSVYGLLGVTLKASRGYFSSLQVLEGNFVQGKASARKDENEIAESYNFFSGTPV